MCPISITSKSYSKYRLLRSLPLHRHTCISFWIPIYIAWLAYQLVSHTLWEDNSIIVLAIIVSAHILFYLVTYHWSVSFRSYFAFSQSSNVKTATHIYLESHASPPAIVPIFRNADPKNVPYYSFVHLEAIFLCFDGLKFIKAKWPACFIRDEDLPSSLTEGTTDESFVPYLKDIFGKNSLDVPIPSFLSLMYEHVLAPFFVFQLVCIGLWMLDTYWYHSLMTLMMLFVFESTVVFQRLKNIKEIRGMASPPQSCLVKRCNKWIPDLSSEELLPGDIIGIPANTDVLNVPADLLILQGSCIVNEALLSGESTPCVKEGVDPSFSLIDEMRQTKSISLKSKLKNSVLFNGTKILQVTSSPVDTNRDVAMYVLVVRTGFLTTQGKLVRTMCLGRERMTANNAEAGYFLLFLLCFAIVAAVYVWNTALVEDPERSRWRLFVQCLLIITSVVPPELPMELSMAVNASLLALSRLAIFCTEPFRLPIAGSIDVCCFDKTGTLTNSDLEVVGMSGIEKRQSPSDILKDFSCIPGSSQLVIASCHSLVLLNNTIAGDPLEVAALNAVPWELSLNSQGDKIIEKDKNSPSILRIIKRFAFSPSLKRMSVIVEVERPSKILTSMQADIRPRDKFVTCKGAPEVIHMLLIDPPKWYFDVAEKYASEGCRVIALAYKNLRSTVEIERDVAESKLTFAGFLIFGTSLKKEAFSVIQKLSTAHHKNVMITGDHALTAIHVAKKLQMSKDSEQNIVQEYLLVDCDPEASACPELITVSDLATREQAHFKNDYRSLEEHLSSEKLSQMSIAITGAAFELLWAHAYDWLQKDLLKRITICARFSPTNKENILRLFKSIGWSTLMCGDGTNDVGALKQAHIGIALLDGTPEDLVKIAQNQRKQALKKKYDNLRKWGFSDAQISQIQAKDQTSLLNDDDDDDEVPVLQFGDASVAAPFTSKIGTLESVCHILRQGRATLAATFQMYKILALNSLITAYSLSVLHTAGVRLGDFQLTVSGLLLSSCFFFLSRSKPLSELSRDRPATTIFTAYSMISIIGQFAVHCLCLIYLDHLVRGYPCHEKTIIHSEDYTFTPSLMNSAIYLLSLLMQVSTFAINYQGPPFRESIFNNNGLIKSLAIVGTFALASASELFPEMNAFMQIVPFPPGFSLYLLALMIGDFGICLFIERLAKKLFSKVAPKWKASQ